MKKIQRGNRLRDVVGARHAVPLRIRGENDDLTVLADSFAGGSDAGFRLQYQMQDAPFTRGHGIESKRGMSFADAVGGNAGGELQLLDANGAIPACVKTDSAIELGIQP